MDGPSRRPSEQHRSEGSLSKAKTRMPGGVSFAYFALHKQRKVRRPAGRNRIYQPTTRIRATQENLWITNPHRTSLNTNRTASPTSTTPINRSNQCPMRAKPLRTRE